MQPLAFALADEYMAASTGVQVAVTGGGSGAGIQAVLDGTADVACTSRPLNDGEHAVASARGVELTQVTVAYDAIVVVVSPEIDAEMLSMEQLKQIFTGVTESWNVLGGANEEIHVVIRDSSSGTFAFFQEHVLGGERYARRALRTTSNESLIHVVSSSEHAVGYVGLLYVGDPGRAVRVVPVADDEHPDGVEPSVESVRSHDYPIWRGLYLVHRADAPATVQDFVTFAAGEQGQRIVAQEGLVPAS